MNAPLRVLIVAGDELTALIARTALEDDGFEVVTAHDALSSQSLLDTTPFDGIVFSRLVPGANGLRFLEAVRTSERNAGTRTLVMCALARPDEIGSLRAAGADAYLPLPLDPPHFLETVRSMIDAPAGRRDG